MVKKIEGFCWQAGIFLSQCIKESFSCVLPVQRGLSSLDTQNRHLTLLIFLETKDIYTLHICQVPVIYNSLNNIYYYILITHNMF